MTEIYSVRPNISDPEMMPSGKIYSAPPPPPMPIRRQREEVADDEEDEPKKTSTSQSTNNRNLIIILVVLAVIVILFLAFLYFYKGQEGQPQPSSPTPPALHPALYSSGAMGPQSYTYRSATDTAYPPIHQSTQSSSQARSRSPHDKSSASSTMGPDHDHLVEQISKDELKKLLNEKKLKQTHDNYPSEYNKGGGPQDDADNDKSKQCTNQKSSRQPGCRVKFAETYDDDQEDDDEKPEPDTAPVVSDDNVTDDNVTDTKVTIEDVTDEEKVKDVKSESSVVPPVEKKCGAPLKTGGTCKRRILFGDRCQQHRGS